MAGSRLRPDNHRFGKDYAKLGKYDEASRFRSRGMAFTLVQKPFASFTAEGRNIVIYDHSK
jgi:hypothetical protein